MVNIRNGIFGTAPKTRRIGIKPSGLAVQFIACPAMYSATSFPKSGVSFYILLWIVQSGEWYLSPGPKQL